MRALVAALLVFLIVGASVRAQTDRPLSTPLRFDAASIKLHQSDEVNGSVRLLPDRGEVVNLPAKSMIAFAYGVRTDQVVGGPGWVERDRFDIKAAAGRTTTQAELKVMFQSLLADRFQLVTHHETRQLPVWALVVVRPDGKLGPSLRRCDDECTPGGSITYGATNEWKERAATIADIVPTLAAIARGTVIDRSGLTGRYEFNLHWTFDNALTDQNAVTLFTALKEQLGLALEAGRGPVDVLVIDRLERPMPD